MEQIRHISEIARLLDFPDDLTPWQQEGLLKAFHAGQQHLGNQVLEALEQVIISVELNDGSFTTLIEELHSNLRGLLG